jgi:hypothetical protein
MYDVLMFIVMMTDLMFMGTTCLLATEVSPLLDVGVQVAHRPSAKAVIVAPREEHSQLGTVLRCSAWRGVLPGESTF